MYGRGHSERIVGQAIRGRRDTVTVMTKCGLRWDDDRGPHFFDSASPSGGSFAVHRNLRAHSIRTEVEVVAPATLPRTDFKARRVVDDRDVFRQMQQRLERD